MMTEEDESTLLIIALCDYDPTGNSGPAIDEAVSSAPGKAFQLLFTRGQLFNVVGGKALGWWLFVRGVNDEGYVPSTCFVPLQREMTKQEHQDFMDSGILPSHIIKTDIDLRFFPDAPQDRNIMDRDHCPRKTANILSRLLFWWLNRLILTGFKRPLENTDLWQLEEANRSSRIVPRLQQEWKKEQDKLKRSKKPQVHVESEAIHLKLEPEEVSFSTTTKAAFSQPSLRKALSRVFGGYFAVSVVLKLGSDSLLFVQPQLLSLLIHFIETPNEEVWRGYVYVVCMVITAILQYILAQHSIHQSFMTGMKTGTALMGIVYTKAMSLSSSSRKQSTVGEIVNLMAIDSQRVVTLINTINQVWSAPMQIVTAIYFLYVLMGASILVGVAVLLLLVPLNILVTRISRRLQVKQLKFKDDRVKLISEVLSGIKVLKLYAWEEAFMERIMGIRKSEIHHLTNSLYLNASVSFTFICAPFLVSLATFTVYVLTGNELTATKAFVAISLFNILRFPLAVFPRNIVNLIQAQVSFSRLTEFLNMEEVDPENVIHAMPAHVSSLAVHVQHGSFSWQRDEPAVLDNINLDVPAGSLIGLSLVTLSINLDVPAGLLIDLSLVTLI
ncbi:multidrug resistance-associated protein 1 [Nematostella vectensis]|uniref:multidrug resistance-associated protein 1 n=1 Tax=Nematostella vectensis TaxID=45351 RepID=UPI0020772324|nr:multidrug resistance-associated protein 1 [Nematostella vectensis]